MNARILVLFLAFAVIARSELPLVHLQEVREHPDRFHDKSVRFVAKCSQDWEGTVIGEDPKNTRTWLLPEFDREELKRTSNRLFRWLIEVLGAANGARVMELADREATFAAVEIDAEGVVICGALTAETKAKQARGEDLTYRDINTHIRITRLRRVSFDLATEPNQ